MAGRALGELRVSDGKLEQGYGWELVFGLAIQVWGEASQLARVEADISGLFLRIRHSGLTSCTWVVTFNES